LDIRSTPSAGSRQTETGRARDAASPAAARAAAVPSIPPASAPVDRVELSAAARELARLEDARSDGGVSVERMRLLGSRIRVGHYDRADTVDRITTRVLDEIAGNDSQG
jgi:hypothetical protein